MGEHSQRQHAKRSYELDVQTVAAAAAVVAAVVAAGTTLGSTGGSGIALETSQENMRCGKEWMVGQLNGCGR